LGDLSNYGSVGSRGTSRDDKGGSKEAWNKTGASSENETPWFIGLYGVPEKQQ